MGATTKSALDPKAEEGRLKTLVSDILDEARRQGADACEVGVSLDAGLSVGVRMGDVETVEFNRDQGFGITVYRGKRKGSASTSDSSAGAIRETVKAAYDIAGYASEDPSAGLADKELMAEKLPDLDLYHPWGIEADDAIELALQCEDAGRTFDARISNSDGANVATHQGCRVYGNSHGFTGSYVSTRHSLSCVLIGQSGDDMQRDYWYTVARDALELESASPGWTNRSPENSFPAGKQEGCDGAGASTVCTGSGNRGWYRTFWQPSVAAASIDRRPSCWIIWASRYFLTGFAFTNSRISGKHWAPAVLIMTGYRPGPRILLLMGCWLTIC